MGLEDFERELAASKELGDSTKHFSSSARHPDHVRHRRHDSGKTSRHDRARSSERSHRHRHKDNRSERSDRHRAKRRRSNSNDPHVVQSSHSIDLPGNPLQDEQVIASKEDPKRDAWMQTPSALDIDYVQKSREPKPETSQFVLSTSNDFGGAQKPHSQELARHLGADDGVETLPDLPAQHTVSYTFGDSGSQWRMTKLRNVYRQAQESGQSVDDVAYEKYGGHREFDDAREEERELDRRERYGKDYVGLEKPSGELFQERKMADGAGQRGHLVSHEAISEQVRQSIAPPLNATELNKLKAQVMKAKLRKDPIAADLEAQYKAACAAPSASATVQASDVTVLEQMDRSLLADRGNQVTAITNKRGLERGLVEENENMSIEDMVRAEKASSRGNSGREFAERIAKDPRFKEGLDYMDDNAARLAKNAPKSDISMRNITASEYHRIKRQLDSCPLCSHEDRDQPPAAPVVALGTRTFLTLPTDPELPPPRVTIGNKPPRLHGAVIVPIKHRNNLLECDDDEWEEIRNFMKSLTKMYHDLDKGVIFYEDAARKRHAALVAVPLEYHLVDTAPAFFKEAVLAQAEEWTQHRKIIDTSALSQRAGYGRWAVRKALHKEMPYFHVWFTLDGGLGHIIEDVGAWPKGELFARDVLGGMLDMKREDIKKQGAWIRGDAGIKERVKEFQIVWNRPQYDWTLALIEAGSG